MNGYQPYKNQLPLGILGGVALFWYWAVELLFSTAPLDTTPMFIWKVVSNHIGVADKLGFAPITATLLFVCGAMTLHGLTLNDIRAGHKWLLPQGFLLLVQGAFCLYFAQSGHYADGTPCPPSHIRPDQMPFIIAFSLMHTVAVMDIAGGSFITKWFNFLCLKIQINRG